MSAKKPCGCGPKDKPGEAAPATAIVQFTPAGRPKPTRPSCLECVEKHLGAAWVLLAEYRDGYPHRMRAVGHLHEAEDEAQAWPELHDAIRDARKAYQSTRTIPDFAALAELIGKLSAPAPEGSAD